MIALQRANAQQSVISSSEQSEQIETKRRIWRPPSDSGSLLDAFREKIDIAAAAKNLRSTLYGSFVLSGKQFFLCVLTFQKLQGLKTLKNISLLNPCLLLWN